MTGTFTYPPIITSLAGCGGGTDSPIEPEQAASVSDVQTTVVTDENYGLAESEIIFSDYVNRIAAATNSNGVGMFLHLKTGADPKERTVMRINFDTTYSTPIVDLTEDAVLTMLEADGRYQSAWIITDQHYKSMAFVKPGKKGEVPLKEHNAGTAAGWGGLTAERAVYPFYFPENAGPQTLTVKDVPTIAFWPITVYNAEGYPQGDVYNINSQFAAPNEDGSVTIHFGGDENAANYMDIFEGWNIVLRIYEPTEAYFNGEWVQPELKLVE